MSESIVITKVSPVLRFILNLSEGIPCDFEFAEKLLAPYVIVGPDGFAMIPEDADISPWMLRMMRGEP